MRQSIRSLTRHPPWATLIHARWLGIWILPGWGGECELKVSSLSSGIQMLYLWKWSFFKVKSSLSRAHGSEGPQGQGFKAWSMYRKSCTIIDFAFYKKWMGHLNLVLATEKGNLNKPIFQSGAKTVIKAASKLFITCKVRSQVCSVSRY